MENDSIPCLKTELDLFNNVGTQLSIDSSSFVEIHPIASLTDKTPIEFYVSGNGEQYLDLAHTILHLKVKIQKNNGTALAATDEVSPTNYFLNTLFSECSIFLNDKQVSSQSNYSYRAILESLLLSSKSVQETLLSSALFFKDTAGSHNDTDANSANDGYKTRRNICKTNEEIDLIGGLHFDLSNQSKLLVNGVNLRIKLERNKDCFALMSSANDFKIHIQSASLYLRKINVAPSIIIAHEKALEKGLIKMPIKRVDIKTFALSSGLQSTTIANAFIGQLPSRLILGFVSNEAYNGQSNKNPFKFSHYNLNYLCVLVGGQMFPAKAYQPNFEKNSYARCYLGLFTDLNRYHMSPNININFSEYKNGYTLYAFDLTPDMASGENHMSIVKSGNIAIDVKFNASLPETVTLVCYAEYRSTVEIDKSRAIYLDY